MSYQDNPMMRYYTMTIEDRKSGRVFEYVYPGHDAKTAQEVVMALYGDGFAVSEPVLYGGRGAKVNRTPQG